MSAPISEARRRWRQQDHNPALGHEEPATQAVPARNRLYDEAVRRALTVLWKHVTQYAGMAWLLYAPNQFMAVKLRVWIDHLVEGLATCVV